MVVRGGGDLEITLPHGVEAMEVVEVGQEDLRLDHVIERRAGGLEGLFQIFEDVRWSAARYPSRRTESRLSCALRRNASLEIARELAGGEHQIVDDEGLVIVGERARNARFDYCNRHVFPLCHNPTSPDGKTSRIAISRIIPMASL